MAAVCVDFRCAICVCVCWCLKCLVLLHYLSSWRHGTDPAFFVFVLFLLPGFQCSAGVRAEGCCGRRDTQLGFSPPRKDTWDILSLGILSLNTCLHPRQYFQTSLKLPGCLGCSAETALFFIVCFVWDDITADRSRLRRAKCCKREEDEDKGRLKLMDAQVEPETYRDRNMKQTSGLDAEQI